MFIQALTIQASASVTCSKLKILQLAVLIFYKYAHKNTFSVLRVCEATLKN